MERIGRQTEKVTVKLSRICNSQKVKIIRDKVKNGRCPVISSVKRAWIDPASSTRPFVGRNVGVTREQIVRLALQESTESLARITVSQSQAAAGEFDLTVVFQAVGTDIRHRLPQLFLIEVIVPEDKIARQTNRGTLEHNGRSREVAAMQENLDSLGFQPLYSFRGPFPLIMRIRKNTDPHRASRGSLKRLSFNS